MMQGVKRWLKYTPLYAAWFWFQNQLELRRWTGAGRTLPVPHARKQAIVRQVARQHSLSTLVETGTFRGDIVYATRRVFDRIVSIELSETLHAQAVERFRRYPHIQILRGDSADVLPKVLATLTESTLFWLDGHYSGGVTARGSRDTPIWAELTAVLRHPVSGHQVLVDDARCFTGQDDYPTMEAVRALVNRERPDWNVSIAEGIIRIGKG
jgi:hypothetical protein